jgi:hypothetical protein
MGWLPAVPAIAAISATPAAVTTASATTAAVTTASAAVTSSPAAAARALGLRPRLIHHEISPAEVLTIQRIDGAIRIVVIGHFHERKAPRLACKTVPNEIDPRWCYPYLRKPLVKLIFRSRERKISHIELLHC